MKLSNVLGFGSTNSTFSVTEVENHKVGSGSINGNSSSETLDIDEGERSSYTPVDPDHELPSSFNSSSGHVNLSFQVENSINPVVSVHSQHLNGHSNGNGVTRQQVDLPELYKRLIHEAPYVPAIKLDADRSSAKNGTVQSSKEECSSIEVAVKVTSMVNIDWVDHELISEGKKFIRRNFFAVIFAHMVALAFLLVVKPIQSLLVRTGAVHNKEKSLSRYLLTILHIKRWYESDFLEQSSKANEDIISVRKMFEKAAKNFYVFIPPPSQDLKLCEKEEKLLVALNEDLRSLTVRTENRRDLEKIYTTVNPDVPLSQYDMAVIQFAFFGLVSCFPKVFGIHESQKNSKGMEGFIHIWAVLGRLLGMEDKYNLCLKENFDEKTNDRIFKEIFLFSYQLADATAIRLWKAMTAGSYRYFFFFRTKSLLLFMAKNVGQVENCPKLCDLMSWMEKFCYFCYSFTMNWELRIFLIRWCLNAFSRSAFFFGKWFYMRKKKKTKKPTTLADLSIYGSSNDGATPLAVIMDTAPKA